MKDLFEDLNKAVPSNAGAKASKWEILTKGAYGCSAPPKHSTDKLQLSSTSGPPSMKVASCTTKSSVYDTIAKLSAMRAERTRRSKLSYQ